MPTVKLREDNVKEKTSNTFEKKLPIKMSQVIIHDTWDLNGFAYLIDFIKIVLPNETCGRKG